MDEGVGWQITSPKTKGTLEITHVMNVHVQKELGVITTVADYVFGAKPTWKLFDSGVTSRHVFDEADAQDARKSAIVHAAAIPRVIFQRQLVNL